MMPVRGATRGGTWAVGLLVLAVLVPAGCAEKPLKKLELPEGGLVERLCAIDGMCWEYLFKDDVNELSDDYDYYASQIGTMMERELEQMKAAAENPPPGLARDDVQVLLLLAEDLEKAQQAIIANTAGGASGRELRRSLSDFSMRCRFIEEHYRSLFSGGLYALP